MNSPARSEHLFRNTLGKLVRVRPDEIAALLWSSLYFFSLMAGYYILRPLREDMGVSGGVKNLPWLFTGTLAATLAVHPLFTALVSRYSRRRFIPLVYRSFGFSLLAFFIAFRSVPAAGQITLARLFYIWTSVFILVAVSVFWGFMADLFTSEQGKRLFGFIGAGGTLGAIAGPALTVFLVVRIGPVQLLLLAIAFLEIAILAIRRIGPRNVQGTYAPTVFLQPAPPAAADPELARGGVGGGIARTFSSPYLLMISAYMLLFPVSSTFLYLEQARIIDAHFSTSAARTAAFGRIDLYVNVLAVLLQVLATGRLMCWLGVGLTAAILPLLTLGGFAGLAVTPTLSMLFWFQVARRAVDYAIARPAREVLFTVVRRDEKYKAKSFIDTCIYRVADALGAWVYAGLGRHGWSPRALALLIVPLSVVWLLVCLLLGHRQRQIAASEEMRRPRGQAAALDGRHSTNGRP